MSTFELPPAEREIFYQTVWKIVRLIPLGMVCTYGQIAEYIPAPSGIPTDEYKALRARWTGHAMAACPPDVPWQRVVNSQGKISLRPGAEEQRRLLEAEGVSFDSHGRIDLKRFAWSGPDREWLCENHLVAPDEPQQPSLF